MNHATLKLQALLTRRGLKEIAWYPSAGGVYRDVLETSKTRLAFHGLEHAPDVFIHTDPTNDFSNISESDVLHQDLRTTVTVKSVERIWIPQPYRQEDDCHEMGERGSEITVLEVIARSDVLGRIDATIVHVPRSNYEFFNEFVVQGGIRFGTLVKVRLGCGMGMCRRCICDIYPWLYWAGCRQVLADGEVHPNFAGQFEVDQEVERHHRREVRPNFCARRTQLTNPIIWSEYQVHAYRLEACDPRITPISPMELIHSIAKPPWGRIPSREER